MQETIIIPAAGCGRRMKSYGPKALISLDGNQCVLTRQINILRKLMPEHRIVVITGFEADKIKKVCKKYNNIITVENPYYDYTNVAFSISLGLDITPGPALIIYGDLVFNKDTIKQIPVGESVVVVDKHKNLKDTEVGVTVVKGKVTRFSYGLPNKWAQIMVLQEKECKLFRQKSQSKAKRSYFSYEILNEVIDSGSDIYTVEPEDMKIVEIDSSKDIEEARTVGE